MMADDIEGPNGLAFSPDESILYVVASRAAPNRLDPSLRCEWMAERSWPTIGYSLMQARARPMASGSISTAICGAAGAWGMPRWMGCGCSMQRPGQSAISRCRSAPPICALAAGSEIACSWRPATVSTRCMSTRRARREVGAPRLTALRPIRDAGAAAHAAAHPANSMAPHRTPDCQSPSRRRSERDASELRRIDMRPAPRRRPRTHWR